MIKYEDIKNPTSTDRSKAVSDETRRIVRRNIGTKWDRLSDAEIAGIASTDQLVDLIVAKYGADREQALADVTRFLKGRSL